MSVVFSLGSARSVNSDDPKAAPSIAETMKKELAPKLVTLQAEKIKLHDALRQLAKQTGIEVEDRRRPENVNDPEIAFDLKKVTFWQALDQIAKDTDLRVNLYQRGGVIALTEGPNTNLPISYDGIFRTIVRRVTAVHDLETDQHFCLIMLEIAWEPRFHPLFLESKPQNLDVRDDNQETIRPEEDSGGKIPVQGKVATTVEVRLPAPIRRSIVLGKLKGSLLLTGPTKMIEFEFDTLAKEKAAKDPKQTKDGVTVKLRKLDLDDRHWSVEVGLEYPEDGPKFESFQSWVVNNECFLKKAESEGNFPCNGGYSIDSLGSSKAILSYHFVDGTLRKTVDGKPVSLRLVRGKPENWKLVYRTPGPMVEVPVTFDFKDVPLP
jgi:hypothetical protein